MPAASLVVASERARARLGGARSRGAIVFLGASLLLAGACGSEPNTERETAGDSLTTPAVDPWQSSIEELRGAADAAGHIAARDRGGASAGEKARRAADLLRVLAVRSGDRAPLEQARRHLEAEHQNARSSCELSLELARLLAGGLHELEAARRVADESVRRFRDDAISEKCVGEHSRIVATLEPFSGAEALAANVELGGTLVGLYVHRGPSRGGQAPAAVRVALYLDRPVTFSRDELPADGMLPRRLFVDLPGVQAAKEVASSVEVNQAGLLRVRRGEPRAGVARIVLDLQPGADYRFFYLTDPYRLLIDVAPDSARETKTDSPLVVLDPGHGGDDYGARYQGMTEAGLVLDIARRTVAVIASRYPNVRVLLTRNDDRFVSLDERVAIANAVGADLFVSLHLNAADTEVERGGVTTFVLDTNNDRQALRLAARENGTTTAEVTELQRLLAGLQRQGQSELSRRLAEGMQTSVLHAARRQLPGIANRGVRSAMFYVLVGARMPAVLLEASFLTYPQDARALRKESYRQTLAEGVADGIAAYVRR